MLRTLARTLSLAALVPFLLAGSPAVAATKAQRMETCKFGADHDKLSGKKRSDFMKHCMANTNYEPAARQKALKKSEAVLDSEPIPLGHRQTIRRYFEAIRPTQAETDKVNEATKQ